MWEMDGHMTGHIMPSLELFIRSSQDETWFRQWVKELGVAWMCVSELASHFYDKVMAHPNCTNGGHEFYIPEEVDGEVRFNITVPWCEKDEMLAYHG